MGHHLGRDGQVQSIMHELPHGSKSSTKRYILGYPLTLAATFLSIYKPTHYIFILSFILVLLLLLKPKKVRAESEKKQNIFNNLDLDFWEDVDILPVIDNKPHKYENWTYIKDMPIYISLDE